MASGTLAGDIDETAGAIIENVPYLNTELDRVTLSYDVRSYDSFTVEPHKVKIHNGRLLAEPPSLDREGFLLADWPSTVVHTRLDELIEENARQREDLATVNAAYIAELIPLMERLSGAREVFAQSGTTTIRFSNRAAHRSWMTTAAFAHLDFEASQVEELLEQTLEITGRKVEPYSRHVLLQTWRVITPPPQDMPLTICDGRTVSTDEMVPMDFHGPANSRNPLLRSRACRYHPRHRWYYFPNMTVDEVLVFKGFDSASPYAMNAMHTAFDDTTVKDAVPRGSIECRFIALYD